MEFAPEHGTTERTAYDWDRAPECLRIQWAKCARWINRKGELTPTGKRIARSAWNQLSPAAQNVLDRVFKH